MTAVLAKPRLPEALQGYAGQLLDIDSHEMMPAQQWGIEFGPVVDALTQAWTANGESYKDNATHPNVPNFTGDDRPIDPETIWSEKGCWSPGAVDAERRLDVMDAMGIAKQIMFPTGVGMFGLMAYMLPAKNRMGFLEGITEDRRRRSLEWIGVYNDWALRASRLSPRLRPALPLIAETVDALMETTRRLLDQGARAFWLPSAHLPGGKSPAHYDLDPFWDLLASSNALACLHLGGDSEFLPSMEWGEAQPFDNFKVFGEFRADPWWLSVQHIPHQIFLQTITVGGVFERHPDLRFGVMETGCHWIGPMLQNLDMWWENSKPFGHTTAVRLPNTPSYYIRRNVRSSPFDFEPVADYIERYSEFGLQDILCFASDYPHVEGGKDPIGRLYEGLARLGPEIVEKFFVKNARLLFPD